MKKTSYGRTPTTLESAAVKVAQVRSFIFGLCTEKVRPQLAPTLRIDTGYMLY